MGGLSAGHEGDLIGLRPGGWADKQTGGRANGRADGWTG